MSGTRTEELQVWDAVFKGKMQIDEDSRLRARSNAQDATPNSEEACEFELEPERIDEASRAWGAPGRNACSPARGERECKVERLGCRVAECRRVLWKLVQDAAEATGCSKRELRNAVSRMRRRIVRLNAARQLLAGKRSRVCLSKGRWPTDHGHPIRSVSGVLKALASRLRRDWGGRGRRRRPEAPRQIMQGVGKAPADSETQEGDRSRALATKRGERHEQRHAVEIR